MVSGIHFILTYTCNYECDHCFLYCGPEAQGTFTLPQLREVMSEVKKIKTVDMIYFEGGESFLFYPLLREGIKLGQELGCKTGVVTNAYWATSIEDAKLWLVPLIEAGLNSIEVSDDAFHYGDQVANKAKCAVNTAKKLGLDVSSICISNPSVSTIPNGEKGAPIYEGGPKLRGRAVDKLTADLPTVPWDSFPECPFEELRNPDRVHIDAFGNVHLCQGLSMGNIWEKPLSQLLKKYDADSHPICSPLLAGGPTQLTRSHKVGHDEEYVDACHLCTHTCKALIDKYPEYLAPRQVFGLDET
jgi:MoaA/NifB/PqqE/SkfB family radical SAM enzyme